MHIGFIGAGKMARTIARHMLTAGHCVVMSNSRGPESLAETVADLGPGATAGTQGDALETDIVVLAVNWPDVERAVEGLTWTGQILVDATNAHADTSPDISLAGVTRSRAALGGRTSSEIVAGWTKGARLVKSISNIPMAWITDFSADKPRTVIFTSGDDVVAKHVVMELLDQVGFAPVDLGSLSHGGAMHEVGAPLSGLELHLVKRLR